MYCQTFARDGVDSVGNVPLNGFLIALTSQRVQKQKIIRKFD
jgi:hypothetical protein